MSRDLIAYIAESLADNPEAVKVTESRNGGETALALSVAEDDIGKIIGKYGRVAKAMRTVLSASETRDGERYSLEILE